METEPGPKPLLLSAAEINRIRRWVEQYLPPEYDREFIVDTIVLNAWMKDVPHVSRKYVHQKCITAWRALRRERRHNEEAARLGAMKTTSMVVSPQPGGSSRGEHQVETTMSSQSVAERKDLVQEAVGKLSPFERRLVWMRYYDDETIEEIANNVTLRRDQVRQALKVAIYKMRVHLT